MQGLTYAVIVPVWLAVHLVTSPTARVDADVDGILVETADLVAVAPAMLLGYVLPTFAMALPAPGVLSFETKQEVVAGWQAFPLWVGVVHWVFSRGLRRFGYGDCERTGGRNGQLERLRWFYGGLFASAVVGQWSVLQCVGLSHAFPGLFAKEYGGVWDFGKVFVPKGISPATQVESVGEGTHLLLQYDAYVGNAAMVLWASVLLFRASQASAPALNRVRLAALIAGASVLGGPIGLVVSLVWARDELVFSRAGDKGKND